MRVVRVAIFAALIALAAAAPGCDFTAAVKACSSQRSTRCEHWNCLAKTCPTNLNFDLAKEVCASPNGNRTFARSGMSMNGPRVAEGSDLGAAKHAKHAKEHHAKLHHKGKVGMPTPASPCFDGADKWGEEEVRAKIYKVAMDVYDKRAEEHYSEDGTLRWVGIHDHICPDAVPKTSDCSSTVTWIYWTIFGKGNDFLNGENWSAGYTGTLVAHGKEVSTNQADLKIGDLCFYYQPMHHVAIYTGDGMVVSHGMDPVGHYSYKYGPLDYCRRYL